MRARAALAVLGVASAFGAIASPASSVPAPPAAGAVVDEIALASWTFPAGDGARRARWFFAGAFRDTTAGGQTRTIAFAVKGTCRLLRGGRVASCHGRGTGGRIPDARLQVDPALRSARLDLRSGAEVRWTAIRESPPFGYLAGEACQAGTGEGAGMQQVALARGRLFGRSVPADAVESALLARGAMVTECARALARAAAGGDVVRLAFTP